MRQASLFSGMPRASKSEEATNTVSWTSQSLRRLTLLSPVVLIVMSLAVFQMTKSVDDARVAQLTGFVFYWLVGGIVIPLIILGRRGYSTLFSAQPVNWSVALIWAVVGLFLPAAFGFLFAFPYLVPADASVLLPTLALYALVNATLEEVFWRGLFVSQFRGNPWLAVVYPGVMFGIWQLVPWALFSSWLRPSPLLVLAVSISVGLLFGWVAQRTGSIRWTTMAHVLANLSGIGALLIFAPPG